jgi:hypothetical protein
VQWDLGLQGLAVLAVLSLLFGVIAQLIFWGRRDARWVWLVASVGFFLAGLVISEVWFGSATAEELQPNIDGLSFDEVLIGFVIGIPILLIARYLTRPRSHGPLTP